jgi:hypothetical protein
MLPCPVQRGRKSGYAPVGMTILFGNARCRFRRIVIPTGAYPNFLARCTEVKLLRQSKAINRVPRGNSDVLFPLDCIAYRRGSNGASCLKMQE